MAAIYDKALKRKDYSGIIDKEKQNEAAEKKADSNGTSSSKFCFALIWYVWPTQCCSFIHADKDKIKAKDAKDAKANEPKAGADVGKIVNLMSVDCNRVS